MKHISKAGVTIGGLLISCWVHATALLPIAVCSAHNSPVPVLQLAQRLEWILEYSDKLVVENCGNASTYIDVKPIDNDGILLSLHRSQVELPVQVQVDPAWSDDQLLSQVLNMLVTSPVSPPIVVEAIPEGPQLQQHNLHNLQIDALLGVEHWRFGFSGSLFDGHSRSIETDPYPGFELAVSAPLLKWLVLRADFHIGFALLDTRQLAAYFSKANRWSALVSARLTPVAFWRVAPGFQVGAGWSLMSLSNTRHIYETMDSVLPYLPRFSLLSTGPELLLIYTTWHDLVELQGYAAVLPIGAIWIEKAQKNVWPITWDTCLSLSYFVTPQIAVHVEIDHEGFWGVSQGNGTQVLNYMAMLMAGVTVQI